MKPLTPLQRDLLIEMSDTEWLRPMDIGGPYIGSRGKYSVLQKLITKGYVERRGRVFVPGWHPGSYRYRRIHL